MQIKCAVIRLAAIGLLVLPVWAAAADQQAGSGEAQPAGVTAAQVMRLNEEIQALQMELKRVELQAQIAAKKAEMAPKPSSLPAGMGGASLPPPVPGGGVRGPSSPVVTGLEGVDGKLRATVAFEGEGAMVVAEGDILPTGWRVVRITESSVIVGRDKERKSLPFGRETKPQAGASPVPGVF